jgi:hypothetical protein
MTGEHSTAISISLALGMVIVCSPETRAQGAPARLPGPAVMQTAAIDAGRLDGMVTDDRGAPLVGAAITAQGAALQFAVTDDRGRFAFHGLKPGPYLVRAVLPGYANSRRELVQVLPAAASWQAFRLSRLAVTDAGTPPVEAASLVGTSDNSGDHEHGAIAWRLRHLKRGVLRDEGATAVDPADAAPVDEWAGGHATAGRASSQNSLSIGWLPALPVSGQVQLLTASSFDSAGQLFSEANVPAGMAYFAIGAPVGSRGNWAAQVAIAQGDLSTWALSGSYDTLLAERHALQVGVAHGWQQYEGANPFAMSAVADRDREAGALTVTDRWSVSRAATVTLGTRFSRYGYIEGPAMWSPSAALRWEPIEGNWIRALVSQQMTAPGAEEFVPAAVGGLWLPAQRTFSSLVPGAPFRPERTRHVEVGFDRELGTFVFSARAFRQAVDDQLVAVFGLSTPARPRTNLGHYFVASGGDVSAGGWGVGISRPVGTRLRGSIDYARTTADWTASADLMWTAIWAPSVRRTSDRIHDITTSLETEIPETATRVFALYRLSNGFSRSSLQEPLPGFDARFDVQISQRLPFLDFTAAEWEVLVAVRNLFRESLEGMSVYDELLVVRPPKRIVGGVLVRF